VSSRIRTSVSHILLPLSAFAASWLAAPSLLAAQDAPTLESTAAAIELVQRHADFLWTLVAAILVFLMQAGFSLIEAGMTRAKNAVNICMKNLMDLSMGSLAFWLVGFGIMFGPGGGWFGTSGFMLSDYATDQDPWLYVFWIFQTVFAATAATIVSGAMAERTKFSAYIIFTIFLTAFVYPVFGSWAWGSLYKGDGWLEGLGFIDFAGSTVVHSIGGWAALAGRDRDRPPARTLHGRRQAARHAGPQPGLRHPRHVHPLVRVVRLQCR
jgi:ammonium transporter, Amt family